LTLHRRQAVSSDHQPIRNTEGNNKTIYHHIKSLEKESDKQFKGVTEVASELNDYFQKELRKQIPNLDEAPDDYIALGFQVVGYDGQEGKTIKVDVGKRGKSTTYTGMGCTVSGEIRLVQQLWAIAREDPRQQSVYGSWSLQDAIDYAEFLINTTATYQRFSNIIPSVGGDVDIALTTPYRDFTWIRSKELTRLLEEKRRLSTE